MSLLIWLRDLLAVFWAPVSLEWSALAVLRNCFSGRANGMVARREPYRQRAPPAYCAIWAKSSWEARAGWFGAAAGLAATLLHRARAEHGALLPAAEPLHLGTQEQGYLVFLNAEGGMAAAVLYGPSLRPVA